MTVFKNILVASALEEGAIKTLVEYYPTYIRHLEQELGLPVGNIPPPVHYSNRNSFDLLPGERFPKVVVISPGLVDTPTRKGDGQYRASWRLGIGIANPHSDETVANMRIKIYSACARAIIEHNQRIVEQVAETHWVDETYDDLAIVNQNQLCKGAAVYFTVDCEDVVTKWAGPDVPDDEPYVFGIVEDIIIDIAKEAIA